MGLLVWVFDMSDQQPGMQVSLRRLLLWMLCVPIFWLFSQIVPNDLWQVSGPLFLLSPRAQGRDSVVGLAMAWAFAPFVLAYVAYPSKWTMRVSVVACVLWVVTGCVLRHIADW